MTDDLERVSSLYNLAHRTASSPPPKWRFFSSRCPICGARLKKESVEYPIFAEGGENDFASKVLTENGVSPGFYSLVLDHFVCDCGYEFARRRLTRVEQES
jgi:hypothetical protein